MRPARPDEAAALEAFLSRHPETSMFLRQSLAAHGTTGGPERHAARFWLAEAAGGIRGCVALNTAGLAMIQWPDLAPGDFPQVAAALAGEKLQGMNGEVVQIALLRRALGLDAAPASLDRTEPLYRLPLDALILPEGPGTLRAPRPADRPLLDAWRAAYMIEAVGAAPGRPTEAEAAAQLDALIIADRLRVLDEGAGPVAMTSFNACLPDMVQVGGVWTPPQGRGRGLARRAVAAHLAEARGIGARTAILFAANPPAARAYEAIGFTRIGGYHLLMLESPVRIAA
ncbi:GNAT family N-acetyltransferase [Frigidibacter sp. MR17.14]|uniref:GNAT family N-acetyltransferase n=1 Tax=Frigidibacter sp. MR17.14 TaxID=3126509 RepID=UPI003012FD4A